MHSQPSVAEVARHFTEYLDRVANRGETFVLMREGKPVAELRPVVASRRLGDLPEVLASLPHLTEEEAASFDEDITAARAELNRTAIRDPWEP